MSDIKQQFHEFVAMIPDIHAANKANGFWDWVDVVDEEKTEEEELAKINLITSEVSEMLEGVRKNLMDNKLPHRKAEEVELADVLVRPLDFAGYLGCDYAIHHNLSADINYFARKAKEAMKSRQHSLLYLATKAVVLGKIVVTSKYRSLRVSNTLDLIIACLVYADKYKLDLMGAVKEKLAFNRVREDHKPENRAKDGGKKF